MLHKDKKKEMAGKMNEGRKIHYTMPSGDKVHVGNYYQNSKTNSDRPEYKWKKKTYNKYVEAHKKAGTWTPDNKK